MNNRTTGVNIWELVEFQEERPMLALCTDEGSQFYSFMWYMFGVLHLRL